ncbi:MAG: PHP domain-containing protein [Firmicutes bacterium]|nr:PHP domain-containing protein [Bacillota bacterium]
MKPVYADLHVHSRYSDGSETPAELAARANRNGLRALALTDHDMVTGIPELIARAQHIDLEIVPGVEISTDVDGKRIHILGYYIDTTSPELLDLLTYIGELRTENTRLIFENLRELGMVDYNWERVLKHSNDKQWLANTDVFQAMLADGKVSQPLIPLKAQSPPTSNPPPRLCKGTNRTQGKAMKMKPANTIFPRSGFSAAGTLHAARYRRWPAL